MIVSAMNRAVLGMCPAAASRLDDGFDGPQQISPKRSPVRRQKSAIEQERKRMKRGPANAGPMTPAGHGGPIRPEAR
jgi:hypothetical protein